MSNKAEISYSFIIIAIVILGYVAFGLFIAFKHEFKSGRNYVKDDIYLKEEPIRGEGKGVITNNEGFHTLEEVNAIKQGYSSKSKCTECNKNND